MTKQVLVIVGPTAVGKTKLSIEIAKQIESEIISGDSMQIYEGMDIGTGKVTETEMNGIAHYMLDIKKPYETYSVAQFQTDVEHHIQQINEKEKLPILVGGSGLYINAVLYHYEFAHRQRDDQVTKQLEERLKKEGNLTLYEELQKIDATQAAKIHPNNYRRVIRALEIFYTTGLTMTEIHAKQKKTPKYNHLLIGLEMERPLLYESINQRVDDMIADGLVDEVKLLYDSGYSNAQSMKAIGYKELIPYITGESSLEECVTLLKRNSRRYAKRQYTWFKNQMEVDWFTVDRNTFSNTVTDVMQYIYEKMP